MKTAFQYYEKNLKEFLISKPLYSMHIDYHKPYVNRIFFNDRDFRIFLHKIFPCVESKEALVHPHPWSSAIKIIAGNYEMGIGHSETNVAPKFDCILDIGPGTYYEMTEPDGWHYVKPNEHPSYSLMLTHTKNYRAEQKTEQHQFRRLTEEEIRGEIAVFEYTLNFSLEGAKINVDGKDIIIK